MAWSKDNGKLAKQYGDFAKAQGERAEIAAESITQLEYIAPYNADTQYVKNNIVRKDKNSYIALQPTLGNEPTGIIDSPFWGVIAIGGEDGTGNGTVTSVNSVGPDENGNVSITIPDPDLSGLATKQDLKTVNDTLTTHVDVESTDAHSISNISGLQSALDSKSTFSGNYNDLSNRPPIGDLTKLTTTEKLDIVGAINEVNAKPSGGGGGERVKITEIATTSHQSLAEFNTVGYEKLQLVIKGVSHNSAANLGLVLLINGVASTGAYSGHRVSNVTMNPTSNFAITSQPYNSSKTITGHLDVELTPDGIVTVDGMTITSTKIPVGFDSIADFHRGMLRRAETEIYSLTIGYTTTGYMNTGLIELWGVPK
jgi:hypothetical protein